MSKIENKVSVSEGPQCLALYWNDSENCGGKKNHWNTVVLSKLDCAHSDSSESDRHLLRIVISCATVILFNQGKPIEIENLFLVAPWARWTAANTKTNYMFTI